MALKAHNPRTYQAAVFPVGFDDPPELSVLLGQRDDPLGVGSDGRVVHLLGGGAAANWFLAHRGPTMTRGTYQPGFRLALHHKDLKICQAMAAAHDVQLPCVEMTLVHYRRLMEQGFGDEDISALFRLKKQLFEN